jgi:SAM-dependent methyltransferase
MITKTLPICPACTSDNTHITKTKLSSTLYHCQNCDFYFCDSLPSIESASAGENSILTEEEFTINTITSWESRKDLFATVARKRHQLFSSRLKREYYRVLEVGCGIAGVGDEYQRIGLEYTGIDIDDRMVKTAKARGLNVSKTDLLDLDINQKFDIITFSQVLEHIKKPQLFIERIYTLLTADGIVVCDVPNHNSLSGKLSKTFQNGSRWGGIELPHHAFSYTQTSLHNLFSNYFESVNIFAINPQHEIWGQSTPFSIKNTLYYTISEIFHSQSILVIVATNKL